MSERATEAPSAPGPPPDAALAADRDRLVERFTAVQLDLGGMFYEMAIRDHVKLDVLTRKAAELQRVDEELAAVERRLALGGGGTAGACPACAEPFARGAGFCSRCGHALLAGGRPEGAGS